MAKQIEGMLEKGAKLQEVYSKLAKSLDHTEQQVRSEGLHRGGVGGIALLLLLISMAKCRSRPAASLTPSRFLSLSIA